MGAFNPSPQQQAIFDWIQNGSGHALVRARAGTGKTTTCVQAIKHVRAGKRVAVFAFNKIIADEFASRLSAVGLSADVCTLHSLGFKALRKTWDIKGAPDKTRDKRLCVEALGPQHERHAGELARVVSLCKARLTIEEADILAAVKSSDLSGIPDEIAANAVLRAIELSLVKDGTVSFDDMVFVPAAYGWRTGHYDMVFVDETQDMSASQLTLAQSALAPTGRLIIVGDDRQAIYSWRGADVDGIDRMKHELNAVEFPLSVTYRCPQSVVEEAQRVVPDLECPATSPTGKIHSMRVDEADWEVGDAVLSRLNAPLVSLALQALRQGIPARIRGRDFANGLRQWARGLQGGTVRDLLKSAEAWRDEEIARTTPEDEGRITDVCDRVDTLRALGEGLSSVAALFDRLESLFTDAEDSETLVFSSVHRAKGLEWDRVFLLAHTFRPSRSEEEENLWYVALTRTKYQLTYLRGEKAISDSHVLRAVESAREQKAVA